MSKLAFIGGGNMARSLIGGMIARGHDAKQIGVGEPFAEARAGLEREFGVTVSADNSAIVAGAEVLVLAVKPQKMAEVCAALPALSASTLVMSIAAGVTLTQLRRWLGDGPRLLRVMPNTPALVSAGTTALCGETGMSDGDYQSAEALFASVGSTVRIPQESLMDAVTAVSGSGPAYFFLLMEALEAAAIAQGLSPEAARELVTGTALGAAKMAVEDSEGAAQLRHRVTSPGGTTAAAIAVFEGAGLAGIVDQAITAATQRGRSLAAEQET